MRGTTPRRWLSISLATALAASPALCPAATFTVLWEPNPEDTEVVKYRVYRADAAAQPYTLLKTVTIPQTRIEVPTGQTRCFRIAAVDSLGQASPKSQYLCITITTEVGE